jgi:hypothetical protein
VCFSSPTALYLTLTHPPHPPTHLPHAGKNGIFEAVLSSNLSHPNIVHTYQYAFRQVTVSWQQCPLTCCCGCWQH